MTHRQHRTNGPAGNLFEYDMGLMALLEDLHCVVVNRLAGGMSNNSKVYQALLVRQCGLLTPSTLVTNDAKAAHRFDEDHQERSSTSHWRKTFHRSASEAWAVGTPSLAATRSGPFSPSYRERMFECTR